jgi:hypothetical protein
VTVYKHTKVAFVATTKNKRTIAVMSWGPSGRTRMPFVKLMQAASGFTCPAICLQILQPAGAAAPVGLEAGRQQQQQQHEENETLCRDGGVRWGRNTTPYSISCSTKSSQPVSQPAN